MISKRFDAWKFDKGEYTSQGFLKAPAYLTRTGVFKYRKADGTIVRELRHPDDVFNQDSLASLQMAPLTDDHPKEFITADNVKKYSIGWISESIKTEDNKLNAQVVVADKAAIMKVDAGKKELSCGYTADMLEEKGIYEGEEYDYRQTNIRYNHVALVDRGRAGPQVRLRLDSNDATIEEIELIKDAKEIRMHKIILDGKEFEVSQEILDAHTAEMKKKDSEIEEVKAAQAEQAKVIESKETEIKTATEATETLQAKVDSLEEKLKEHKDFDIEAAVKTRVAIEKVAAQVLPKETKVDGKSNIELMKEVITVKSPKVDLSDKSDVYVKARFDAISETLENVEIKKDALGEAFSKPKKDEIDSMGARKKAMDDAKELWKQPLSASKKV